MSLEVLVVIAGVVVLVAVGLWRLYVMLRFAKGITRRRK